MSATFLHLDPSVLAPPCTGSSELARRYVETVVFLSRLFDEPWVTPLLSQNAPTALHQDGLLPLFPVIQKFLCDSGIVEYDAPTVMSVVSRTLRTAGTFEHTSCYKEALFDCFTSTPDVTVPCPGAALLEERQRGTVLTALADACGTSGSYSTFIPHIPDGISDVRVRIHDVDHACPSGCGSRGAFQRDVRVLSTIESLVRSWNFGAALLQCASSEAAIKCIRYAVWQHRLTTGGAFLGPYPAFRVGSKFLSTFQEVLGSCSADVAKKAARAIAECVESSAQRDAHALRTGTSGGAPQRKRGRDCAFRADIDYEFHLHYWRCAAGGVELASVVTHNDFTIPD